MSKSAQYEAAEAYAKELAGQKAAGFHPDAIAVAQNRLDTATLQWRRRQPTEFRTVMSSLTRRGAITLTSLPTRRAA